MLKHEAYNEVFLLHGPGNQAGGRLLILNYFYGFLILRSEKIAGTHICGESAGCEFVWLCICVCLWMCKGVYIRMFVYRCMHVNIRVCASTCIG